MLFEKIFQRDDKSFLLIYRLILGGVLFFSSSFAYYIRNNTWQLSESYIEATILIVITFLILSFINSKENRYIKGTAQWLRIELILLIQTFIIAILLTVLFKTTENYSANKEDIKFFKDKFESIILEDGFFLMFKTKKIKKFILEII